MPATSMIAPTSIAPTSHTDVPMASFSTTWLSPTTAIVSVYGEIDAANAPEFAAHAGEHTARTERLVLDLSKVSFCGTAGLAALQQLEDRCAAERVAWGMTASAAVHRLVGICDVTLPIHPTVAAALDAVRRRSARLFELIA